MSSNIASQSFSPSSVGNHYLSGSLSRVNASAPRHVHGIQQKEIEGVTLVGKSFSSSRLLTNPAFCKFFKELMTEGNFSERVEQCLQDRVLEQVRIDREIAAGNPQPLKETSLEDAYPESDPNWQGPTKPADIQSRRVEITGPADKLRMVVNALTCGADCYMTDFEDSKVPRSEESVAGYTNMYNLLHDGIEKDGKQFTLPAWKDGETTLWVRPRGLHLQEDQCLIDGKPVPGAFLDFAVHMFYNAKPLIGRGRTPAFYLPKLEHHKEAELWADFMAKTEAKCGLEKGTCRATVLIETFPAAFQMAPILYALKDYTAGLNGGRWDYIFSAIKVLQTSQDAVLPDRNKVTMKVPFMAAYQDKMVQECSKRGVHAMGGMSSFVPDKSDPAKNDAAMAAIKADKTNEKQAGCAGGWASHPALVPVIKSVFNDPSISVKPRVEPVGSGELYPEPRLKEQGITEKGLRVNLFTTLQYVQAYLNGSGAVGFGYKSPGVKEPAQRLMEDMATAEISRSQVYQWLKHNAEITLNDGQKVPLTYDVLKPILEEEIQAAKRNEHVVKYDWNSRVEVIDKQLEKLENLSLKAVTGSDFPQPYQPASPLQQEISRLKAERDLESRRCMTRFDIACDVTNKLFDTSKPMVPFISTLTTPHISEAGQQAIDLKSGLGIMPSKL